MSVVVAGDRASVRTSDVARKPKRLRRNPALPAHASLLGDDEATLAHRVLARTYPPLHALRVLPGHRPHGSRMVHLALIPAAS